jgi:hypothetical protein
MSKSTQYLLSIATILLMIAGAGFAIDAQVANPTVGAGQTKTEDGTPPPVILSGETQKICQLTGDVDWETGQPTAARTLKNFGLDAVDLGYPVEHNGKLVFLFGDSWPPPHGGGAEGEVIPDDSVGVTTRTELPTPEACLDLAVHSKKVGGVKKYDPATITGPVKIKQGFFNVPSGGVSVAGSLYGFFWTNHCWIPDRLKPEPYDPLKRPAPNAICPETNDRNSIGRGVMARSNDLGHTFSDVVAMPEGFVYSTAVNAGIQKDLPDEQKLGVFIFGVPRYRASVPYLAYAPVETFADVATWRFFAGRTPDGKPKWVGMKEWKLSPANQIYTPADNKDNNVGEFSITWNRPLRMWLMMYDGVSVRVAAAPWGPWSEPTVILSKAGLPACKLVMAANGCGNRRNYWPDRRHGANFVPGDFYAPFVMNRYTRADAGPRRVTLYWVLSNWNPYEVTVMRTTIELPDQQLPKSNSGAAAGRGEQF